MTDTRLPDLLNRVHEGMHVFDTHGQDVGRVDAVQMGDPEAATTAGNEGRTGPLDVFAEALGDEREPDVPEPLRSRLVRSGYLKLDSSKLLAADRYVPASYVREVADDRVHLSVPGDELASEH